MILGIETATTVLSVAIVEDGRVLQERRHEASNAHDELLAPFCRDILTENGFAPSDLTGIAVSAGPGSFTGLRIGLSVAKGMALALDIPIALVPTLDALAYAAAQSDRSNASGDLLVLLPSRKGEMYAARYALQEHKWKNIDAVAVMKTDEIEAVIRKSAYIAGNAPADIPDFATRTDVVHLTDITVDAAHIALLGEQMLSRGEAADTDNCEPLYVQQFEVKQAKQTLFRRKETHGD